MQPTRTPYTLTLTSADIDAIAFVGHRYCWSNALASLDEGPNPLTESEAWEIVDSFEADTEGGHSYFPMLDSRSDLAEKLRALMEQVV